MIHLINGIENLFLKSVTSNIIPINMQKKATTKSFIDTCFSNNTTDLNYKNHRISYRGRDRANRAPAGPSGAPAGLLLDWRGGRAALAGPRAAAHPLRDAHHSPHGDGVHSRRAEPADDWRRGAEADRLRLLHWSDPDVARSGCRGVGRRWSRAEVGFWWF